GVLPRAVALQRRPWHETRKDPAGLGLIPRQSDATPQRALVQPDLRQHRRHFPLVMRLPVVRRTAQRQLCRRETKRIRRPALDRRDRLKRLRRRPEIGERLHIPGPRDQPAIGVDDRDRPGVHALDRLPARHLRQDRRHASRPSTIVVSAKRDTGNAMITCSTSPPVLRQPCTTPAGISRLTPAPIATVSSPNVASPDPLKNINASSTG